jgi:dimethylaniline monooxygenase (N-oxide forming)
MNNNHFLFNYDENNNYEIFNQENQDPNPDPIQEEQEQQQQQQYQEPIKQEYQEQPIIPESIQDKVPIILDLIVIGGGWSGILACKHAKQQGLNTIILEARSTIGGVWKFSEDQTVTTTIKNAHTTSSKTFTEMSDFPMPKDYPSFPSHKEIYSYLVKYVNHFKIAPHIIFNTKIKNAEKIIYNNTEVWRVEDDKGNFWLSRYLTVSTGAHTTPNIPDKINTGILKDFSGEVIHSVQYKKLTPHFWNKKVLIVGGGETSSDIANEISLYSKKIYWSISNGQWFIPKLNTNTPKGKDIAEPADHYTSAINMWVHPVGKTGGVYLFEDFVEFFWGKCGHGIKEWISDAPYQRQFLNKSSDVLNKIAYGRIIPKRKIQKIFGKKIWFDDGTSDQFDIIMLCTGYKINFPFLPSIYNQSIRKKYKYMFHPQDPSLSFIGFVRPVIGSIPALAEIQSIYMANIYSGKLKLPSTNSMIKIAKRDSDWWNNYFKNTSKRLEGLVNIYIYSNDLMGKCGMKPEYHKLFFKSPLKCWKALSAPYSNSRYLLNQEKYHDQIFSTFEQYKPHPYNLRFWFLHLFYYIFVLIRPFYLFFRKLFANKKTNSLIELDEEIDPDNKKRKIKNLTLMILTVVLIVFIIIVPEWRNLAIENIKKLLGPTDVLKDKRFLTVSVIMILYLLYM